MNPPLLRTAAPVQRELRTVRAMRNLPRPRCRDRFCGLFAEAIESADAIVIHPDVYAEYINGGR